MFRDLGLLNQAAYCYHQALRYDRKDLNTLWERSCILRDTNRTQEAIASFKIMLEYSPHEIAVLRELGPLLDDSSQRQHAIELYLGALNHQQAIWQEAPPIDASPIGPHDLAFLGQMLLKESEFDRVLTIIKPAVRWLQGRRDETFWDRYTDDREFDASRDRDDHQLAQEKLGTNTLSPDIRTVIGRARLGTSAISEARVRASLE